MPAPQAPSNQYGKQQYKANKSGIERKSQQINRQQLCPACQPQHTGDKSIEYAAEQNKTNQQRLAHSPHGYLLRLPKIINQHHGRNTEEIQQMYSYGQTYKVRYQQYPTIGRWTFCLVLPLQHQPEHKGGQETGIGINLRFHGRVPEGIAEHACKSTYQGGTLYQKKVPHTHHLGITAHQTTHKMRYRPEQKHNATGTEQGRHDVHHKCHLRRVGRELGEQVCRKHEERCTWRMTNLQFVSGNDELGAIPQAGCGLNRKTIDRGGNGKDQPPYNTVNKFE